MKWEGKEELKLRERWPVKCLGVGCLVSKLSNLLRWRFWCYRLFVYGQFILLLMRMKNFFNSTIDDDFFRWRNFQLRDFFPSKIIHEKNSFSFSLYCLRTEELSDMFSSSLCFSLERLTWKADDIWLRCVKNDFKRNKFLNHQHTVTDEEIFSMRQPCSE